MRRGARNGFGTLGVAVFAVVCCAGLPLLVGAGVSVTAIGVGAGLTAGLVAAATAITVLALRARGRRGACQVPPDRTKEPA